MTDTHGKKWVPQIAVDLDGTLAHYDGWRGIEHIGEPVPLMMERVKAWVAEGKEVVIFTARVSEGGDESALATSYIHKWLLANGLPPLDITSTKRKQFIEMWDDRAIAVKLNTGAQLCWGS